MISKMTATILFLTVLMSFANYIHAATSQQIVEAIISAHGGMEKWRSAPTVSFEDEYLQAGTTKPEISHVTVEQGRRRAYLDFPETNSYIVWDGKQAWSENWKSPIPPRFLALLNYYFLNLPWLVKDRGVQLSESGKSKLWNDPTEYTTVKMTFGAGVGDTPEDYYILYIDPKSKRLKACEYIATYSSILPPNTKATPPHILVYEAFETVDGLVVPVRYSIFDKAHKLLGTCKIRNWSFKKPFDVARMKMKATAVVDTSKP